MVHTKETTTMLAIHL